MPFTAAHPAIILPFARVKKIPLSVLVIGSLTPDFEYFIKMKLTGRYSHTLEGMFLFDLPVAFILWLIFHQVIKKPLIKNLPVYFKGRLLSLKKFDFIAHMKANLLYIIIGFLIGIFSHIVWDSFTHAKEVFVLRWDWLSQPLFSDFPKLPAYKVLQHTSTLVGSIIIVWYFHHLPQQPCNLTVKKSYWLIFILVAILAFSIRAWFTFEYFGDIVATALSASCIGIIFSSVIYRLRYE
jgi:hypothetical protein